MISTEEIYLTVKQVAEMLIRSTSWVYRNKEIPYSKIGRNRLYKKSDVVNYIEQRKVVKAPPPLTDAQLLSLTNPLENPYLDSGGEISEMPKGKKAKNRFPQDYGGAVYFRPYPSGKKSWGIEYRDENNVRTPRIVRNVQTYKDAVVALRETQREVFYKQYNIKRKQKRIRLFEYCDLYLTNHAQVYKEKSWKSERSYINSMKGFFGNRYLDEIDFTEIEKLKNWMLKQKVLNKNTLIKKSTVTRALVVFSKMFSLAVDWNYLSEEQVPKIKYFPLEDSPRKQTLPDEWEERLFKAFKESPDHLEPTVIAGLYCGLRLGEAENLMWKKNIDFKDKGRITLEGSQTKNGREREIPIHSKLYPWLVELHRKNGHSPYVFVNPRTGKPFTNVGRLLKSACKRAGIEGITFHNLRHTFATRLLVEEGIDPVTVMELMGHGSLKMTERYLHSNQDRKRRAIESLGNNGSEKELKKPENQADLVLNCDLGKSKVEREALSYLFSGRWE